MNPCDKGPAIERITDMLDVHGDKLDKIADSLTVLAVQKDRIDRIGLQVDDHEKRIRGIEATPLKFLYWVLGITATILSGMFLHKFIS